MKKQTKILINRLTNLMFFISLVFLTISAFLFSAKFGFGMGMQPPFCWASFLKMGLFMLSSWAFNKELFYY